MQRRPIVKLAALAAVAALLSVSAQAAEPPLLDLYYSGASAGAGATVMVRACGS